MKQQHVVRLGGLMRCCLATLDEAVTGMTEPSQEGDRLSCRFCKDGKMVFRKGAWEWAGGEEAP